MNHRDFTTQESRIPWSWADAPAISAPQPGPVSVSPGLACGRRKGGCVWGALGRDGEQAAAHSNPWVPGCHHSWLHQGCVCRGGGAGPSPVVAWGWAGRGDRGGRRVTPRHWVGDRGLGALSSAMGEVPRAVGRDTAGVGWEPRYWRRGLPEWVRQAPASGLVPRALLGVQTRVAGGLGSVGRKAGRTSLCGLGDPAPYPAPGVPLDWVVSGLSPMCLGPPALTRLTRGRTRRGRLGALAVGPLGLVSIRAGAGVQGALSVRTHALRVASSARFLWCDSPPSLGLPFWYLLCGETGFRLRTGYPARWGRPGTQPCALQGWRRPGRGGRLLWSGPSPRWENLTEAAAGARCWAGCSPLGRSALPRRGAAGSQCPSPGSAQASGRLRAGGRAHPFPPCLPPGHPLWPPGLGLPQGCCCPASLQGPGSQTSS